MAIISKITAKIPLLARVVSLYMFAIAIVWLVGFAASFSNRSNDLRVVAPSDTIRIVQTRVVTKTVIDGEPQEFIVSNLGIDLPIRPGIYDGSTKSWTLSDGIVYYATITPLPNNQRGNTFLYGHNNDHTIAKLANLLVGDTAIIKTSNGHEFIYAYVGDNYVLPDSTDILYDNPDQPQLTVMTCQGVWSQTRRLMHFNLTEAK